MKKSITVGIITSALLVGCGSDSSSSTNDSNIKANTGTNSEVATTDTLTGYFIDAEVSGVAYETSSGLTGTTDAFGRFEYKSGDKVELRIGKLVLGEAEPTDNGLVTPETLSNGDEELKILLLRTLQSLDRDGDPSNGITIPANLLENIEATSIAQKNENSLLELDTNLASKLDSDHDGIIDTNETQAEAHFDNSVEKWHGGERPDSHDDQTHGNRPDDAGQGNQDHNRTEGDKMVDLDSYPLSALTPELKNSLAYMGNEERLAYDVYHNLYNYHMTESAVEIKQLKNISEKSEIKHVGIVQDIVNRYSLNPEDVTNVIDPVASKDIAFEDMPSGKYDIPAIQALYDVLYSKGVASQKDALEVGCMVEVTDVDDLDRYITMAEESNATDIVDAFNVLRDGSYNHYWAFDKGLKKLDIAEGCCSLGTIDGVDYCQPEYPQDEHGSEEESQGQGNGQGNRQGQGQGHGRNQ